MKTIFVPLDFTTRAEKVMEYVFNLAVQTNANILLFHSFFDQIYFSDGGFATGFETNVLVTDEIIGDFYEQRKQNMADASNALKEKIRSRGLNIRVETRIESGDPEYQILEVSREIEPFLIVMGSKGIGKKGILTGSVTRKVMNHSKYPVIAVPGTEFTGQIRNIAYMTDFSNDDQRSLKKLLDLFEPHKPVIYCIHLLKGNDGEKCREKIKGLVSSDELSGYRDRLSGETLSGRDIQSAINEFIMKNKINLIAFIPHKRNILKEWFSHDITKKDLFLTNVPILGIH